MTYLGNLTVRQYAESDDLDGGVYGFYTEQQCERGIKYESRRFLTDGQKDVGGTLHNAVLMWNHRRAPFPNNVVPYNERLNHGLERISGPECDVLGIHFVPFFDEICSEKDARMIEKAIHWELDHLPLGRRLHRVPGAGKGGQSTEIDGKRRVVGITFLPPDFYKNNPNIAIVASANPRPSDW